MLRKIDNKLIQPNRDNELFKRIVKELDLDCTARRVSNPQPGKLEELMEQRHRLQMEWNNPAPDAQLRAELL